MGDGTSGPEHKAPSFTLWFLRTLAEGRDFDGEHIITALVLEAVDIEPMVLPLLLSR